ncbi:MAG: HD domain-containing protein [Bacteroidales bacterium]|nr:HD domain-containing protein [Bacteroidales bacterium]
MKEYSEIRGSLEKYVFDEIVPKYAGFDPAHREDHVLTVIEQAMELLDRMPGWLSAADETTGWETVPDREVLFAAAACHDLGLVNGRERHHLDSGVIIRSDSRLREWFSEEQIETIAQAAEDHRASGKSAPRSIYGMLVAEADRVIDGETIIRRTIQYGLTNYPELDREGHLDRAVTHLREKYGRGGYLNLWIPWSDNAASLAALQETIADDSAICRETARIYDSLV